MFQNASNVPEKESGTLEHQNSIKSHGTKKKGFSGKKHRTVTKKN